VIDCDSPYHQGEGCSFYKAMKIIGKKIINYQVIDSTNDEAKRLIKKGVSEGAVVLASEQTAGRGKPGAVWFSPPGQGMYLSVIVKPYRNLDDIAALTLLGARAVVNLLKTVAGVEAEIKPPNDILLNGKKICGILVEKVGSGHLIIGIGLNINQQPSDWPTNLGLTATSLAIETGQGYELETITRLLITELDGEYLAYLANS